MYDYSLLETIGIIAIGTIFFMTVFLIYLTVREHYSDRKDKSKDKQ